MSTTYSRLVQSAAWAATVIATLLMIAKLFTWWHTEAVSLLASLVDSLLDILASVTNLLVIRYSLQPADDEHSFGHGKAESLAALAQSAFVVGSACFLLLNGIERFFRPSPLNEPELGIYVSIFATILTGALVIFQKWVVRQTGSQAIAADSLHYQSDLLMNVAIIIALGLSLFDITQADAGFAIAIGVVIMLNAFKMANNAIQSLLDHRLPEDEQIQIMNIATSTPGVDGVHELRTRQSGQTKFIQLHLEIDGNLRLIESHSIADDVEQQLLSVFNGADIIIHQDPVSSTAKSENTDDKSAN
ncbi:cation-efflux pump FieF [Veronia nyctiphanis]|uniref:Cation-efflux pump FieF n=1 Tax=Veronia nyctiphanis TaxID=1278244 RepID=A0A4Q0YQR9_9GAMM|nr:CDF family cation-efflux transporter FieF [Veronia nyctiphanis]RXJ73490.1 cation-efflux pump FieF [Veronia nyctiphanis]